MRIESQNSKNTIYLTKTEQTLKEVRQNTDTARNNSTLKQGYAMVSNNTTDILNTVVLFTEKGANTEMLLIELFKIEQTSHTKAEKLDRNLLPDGESSNRHTSQTIREGNGAQDKTSWSSLYNKIIDEIKVSREFFIEKGKATQGIAPDINKYWLVGQEKNSVDIKENCLTTRINRGRLLDCFVGKALILFVIFLIIGLLIFAISQV